MMRKSHFICIGCPMGCDITVSVDENDQITQVDGHNCKQGKAYAQSEYKNPVRVLTTTVAVDGSSHRFLPVRTNKPIPKDRLMQAMAVLTTVRVDRPFEIGQVVLKNIVKSGADVIATDVLSNIDFD